LIAAKKKSMSFQSSKINAETVLNFPGGASTAQILRSEVLSSQQVLSSRAAPATAEPLLPVLIVLHQETSTPGRIGNALRALGHRLDIRRPRFGDPLPKTLDGHAGAVIFGGPMSANDPDDFVRQ
jgi:GMP synthase (glutamine-hydrolysing)